MEYCLKSVTCMTIFKWPHVKQQVIHCTIFRYNFPKKYFNSQFLVTTLEDFIENVFLMEKKVRSLQKSAGKLQYNCIGSDVECLINFLNRILRSAPLGMADLFCYNKFKNYGLK